MSLLGFVKVEDATPCTYSEFLEQHLSNKVVDRTRVDILVVLPEKTTKQSFDASVASSHVFGGIESVKDKRSYLFVDRFFNEAVPIKLDEQDNGVVVDLPEVHRRFGLCSSGGVNSYAFA